MYEILNRLKSEPLSTHWRLPIIINQLLANIVSEITTSFSLLENFEANTRCYIISFIDSSVSLTDYDVLKT